MFALLLTFIFGLAIAYFAAQNTHPITVTLANYPLTGVPTYFLVIASLLIGLLAGWIINVAQSISTGFAIRGKDQKLKSAETEIHKLQEKIHDLELDNTRLKKTDDEEPRPLIAREHETEYRPSFIDRIRASFG